MSQSHRAEVCALRSQLGAQSAVLSPRVSPLAAALRAKTYLTGRAVRKLYSPKYHGQSLQTLRLQTEKKNHVVSKSELICRKTVVTE